MKTHKILYWLEAIWMLLVPNWWCRWKGRRLLESINRMSPAERSAMTDRANYYCRLPQEAALPAQAATLGQHTFIRKPRLTPHSAYFFDSYRYTRCFKDSLRWAIQDGDVHTAMLVPTITKTRPVLGTQGTSNNVLLNMDKLRHFRFVQDPLTWEQKQGKVLFRGVVLTKENRRKFLTLYGGHPLCDLKDTDKHSTLPANLRTNHFMSIREQLNYRYILSLEGNDVASNLKWVMSSNSLAVMPKPTCESWFMEGRLVGGYHYIEIADDYHDLIEKITYYEDHPQEAQAMVEHAHAWVEQFQDPQRERIISLLTLNNYLHAVNPPT